jgi:hypothetical protein
LNQGWSKFKIDNSIHDDKYTKKLLVEVARKGSKILGENYSCADLLIGVNFIRDSESIEETWSKIPNSKKIALVEASATNKVIYFTIFVTIANTIFTRYH